MKSANTGDLHATVIGEELYLVALGSEGDDPETVAREHYADLGARLTAAGMEVVHERLYGSLAVEEAVRAGRRAGLAAAGRSEATPLTYIQGHPPWGEGFAGLQVHAVPAGLDVRTILDGDTPRGRAWQAGGVSYLYLQDLHGQSGEPRDAQTTALIEKAAALLREAGAVYGDVARTWFYLDDILDWYDDFNAARSAVYGDLGLMPTANDARLLLPASTGIEGTAPHRAAGCMDLLAVVGSTAERPRVVQLSNAGQKDAFRYGSAFSRGAVIDSPESRVIQLSGTASIDESGATIHCDQPRTQIEETLQKIEQLLDQAGAGLGDVVSATAFVKRAEYVPIFKQSLAARGFDTFPAVVVVADVCRDDLLFEMDGEVVVDRSA